MRLFLASESKNPQTIKKIEEVVGIKDKKIAYIPTASNGEVEWGGWKNGETWKLLQTLGADIEIVQLEDFRDDSVVSKLQSKDIVWLAGGMPGYLAYWLRRCSLDVYLPKILENNNMWLVGSSAGSMVMGQTLEVIEWGFEGENERGGSQIKPLGFVNFDIYPHYDESLFSKIKGNYRGNKMYLLKNGEEIIVRDDKIEVVGETRMVGKPI